MSGSPLLFMLFRCLPFRARRFFQVGLASAFIVFGLPSLTLAETESHASIDLTTSAVNFLVPAAIMHYVVPRMSPPPSAETVHMKIGAKRILALLFLPICTAVSFHNHLHLPPVLGMMTGFAYLGFFGHYLSRKRHHPSTYNKGVFGDVVPFDVFQKVARAEWDTLLFFYGVVLCVGGLGLPLYSH